MTSKEESAPISTFLSSWSSSFSNSSSLLRVDNLNSYNQILGKLALPCINEYVDYDFKDWQNLEFIEDILWESSIPGYSQEEYRDIAFTELNDNLINKFNKTFNLVDREWEELPIDLRDPFLKDYINLTSKSTLPLYTEIPYINPTLSNTFRNISVTSDLLVESLDDTYIFNKGLDYSHYLGYLNNLSTNIIGINPESYTNVMNNFRSSVENSGVTYNSGVNELVNTVDLTDVSDVRSTNPIKLRSTAKNAIVTFNALQKVFRPRFDEGRSNVRYSDMSNTTIKYPIITESRIKYENLIGKNTESFFSPILYKSNFNKNLSVLSVISNSNSIFFDTLPFLLSMQSDASRYMWFDWQSRWNSIEVQPSSVSRYSLLGVPYSTKNFEYASQQSEAINESETYLIRMSKARKNYMANWSLTPYLYNRMSNWYKTSNYLDTLFYNLSTGVLYTNLINLSNKWEVYPNRSYTLPTYTINEFNNPGRSAIQPLNNIQGFNYSNIVLSSLLSKREYLYREYFLNQGYSINLPKYLIASPNNPILKEVKASYPLIDPTTFSYEIQRDLYYSNNYALNWLNSSNVLSSLGLNSSALNWFIYYTSGYNSSNHINESTDLYKNQYRPMRKGISNMIRLHATGAIAMPTEIRLHILASSRDIIHSWAIPSAGIKIDCVPGYSSHRVAIFLASGIFWGQCMEICGRFHHWMPIIVYFMKRDLFFLWCSHFIHFSLNENTFNSSTNEHASRIKRVSFSPNWVL